MAIKLNKTIFGNKFLQGVCYDAFPHGYDPSTANTTCIWFGSDMAGYNIKPLWGDCFSPIDGSDEGKIFKGRNDLDNLKNLGVNLIRLYDWDPRNNHIPFLDYCHQLGIQVLVPVSNYNLGAFGPPPDMIDSITSLINSFSLDNDYHPAIYGITIGSEVDLQPTIPVSYVVEYTQKWAQIESVAYSNYRKVPIGHPISFATSASLKIINLDWDYPCFGYLDKLLPLLLLDSTRDLNKRLIICPHTYNEASYLFDNAEGSGEGWIDLAWNKYSLPILICEIGCSRLSRNDYLDVINQQLVRSIEYSNKNKEILLGVCYFQYCDKVWMPDTTEGSFGLVSNTDQTTDIVHYGVKDFTHYDGFPCINNSLNIQILKTNDALNVLLQAYVPIIALLSNDFTIDNSMIDDDFNIFNQTISNEYRITLLELIILRQMRKNNFNMFQELDEIKNTALHILQEKYPTVDIKKCITDNGDNENTFNKK